MTPLTIEAARQLVPGTELVVVDTTCRCGPDGSSCYSTLPAPVGTRCRFIRVAETTAFHTIRVEGDAPYHALAGLSRGVGSFALAGPAPDDHAAQLLQAFTGG